MMAFEHMRASIFGDTRVEVPYVAESMREAVCDPSRPLVIAAGGQSEADRLAEHGIAALTYPDFWHDGPARSSDSEWFLDPSLYQCRPNGRRITIVAPPYIGRRDSNTADRAAVLLRDEGAPVTVVPDAGDVLEAVKAAAHTFGRFRRTTDTGGDPEKLIDDLLYKAQNHLVYGNAANGKTMFALYLCSILIQRGLDVVYLDRENGRDRIYARMRALGCTEEQLDRHFHYFDDPPGPLDDAPDYGDILDELEPALVVFDSFFGFLSAADLDENYGRDVAKWFDNYAPPTLNAATIILDHPPKSGDTARGSSRKLDAVDVAWKLSGSFSPESAGAITLKRMKARDGGLPEKVAFTVGGTPFGFERAGTRELKPEERTLGALEDGMTAGAWLDASGQTERTFFRHRGKLLDAELVEERDGVYCHVAAAE